MMANVVLVFREVISPKLKVPNVGGIETYLVSLSSLLINNGYDVTLLQRGMHDYNFDYNGVRVVGYAEKKSNCLVDKHIKTTGEAVDLVVWGTDSISKKIKGIPTISIQHGIGFDYVYDEGIKGILSNFGFMKIYRLLQRLQALRYFSRADQRVCVDYNFVNWYRTYAQTDQTITVIPNFTPIDPNIIKEKTNSDVVKVLFARRFVKKRGVYEMISAAQRILSRYSHVTVTFAGDGPLKSDIEKAFCDDERVTITTYSFHESLKFHSEFDIAVVPTLGGEGTSLSLLEAMSAGCCVIGSNVGGITNILIDNYNGRIVTPTVDNIEHAISELILDDKKRKFLAVNSYDTVRHGFSLSLWESKWLNTIKLVLDTE